MSDNNHLFQYLEAPDASFRWELLESRGRSGGTLFDLKMISQTWQGLEWSHRLHVYIPSTLRHPEWALLGIESDYTGATATHIDLGMADELGVIGAYLYDVPNQPLFDGLREDELLAHTLSEYLDTEDETWPILYPMVKAAQRAMDVVSALSKEWEAAAPERFIVHGASKRGWTTWLAAVSDTRVAAILPEVYDNLNLFAQMPHQVKVWHAYSEMIEDYTQHRLQDRMKTPRGQQLALTIDPYSYRAGLTLPKLLIQSLNDRYWATDALNLYWDALPGLKHALYVPNQPHYIADRENVTPTVAAFIEGVLCDSSIPSVTASYLESPRGLEILLRADSCALAGRLWCAASATEDFRECKWNWLPLIGAADGSTFTGRAPRPREGFVALMAECILPRGDRSYALSTPVTIMSSRPEG